MAIITNQHASFRLISELNELYAPLFNSSSVHAIAYARLHANGTAEGCLYPKAHLFNNAIRVKQSVVLTPTERAVLTAIGSGQSVKQIARARHVSYRTVYKQSETIRAKLDCRTTYQAFLKAKTLRLISACDNRM